MAREFKRFTGLTPNEYLINARITAAKRLLKHSNMTVAEISEQVGFNNNSHFINLFKKQEEMTPLSFRKKWRKGG